MEGAKLCGVCQIEEFKYTCPACGMKTCGIDCVKRHKKQYDCSGIVDQTKFLTRQDISQDSIHLKRDYNFLVGFERQVQLKKQDIKSKAKNIFKNNDYGNQNRNKRFKPQVNGGDKRLEKVNMIFPHQPTTSIKRQNTLIINQPVGMSRCLSNKSGYDKKSSSFVWTIEWILLDENGKQVNTFLSYRLKESLVLQDAVPMNILNKHEHENYEKSKLNFYLNNVLHEKKSVIKLDKLATISDNLKDKVVLVFPSIYITTNDVLENGVIDIKSAYFLDTDSSSESDSSESSDSSLEDEESSLDEAPEEESSKLTVLQHNPTSNPVTNV